MAGVRGCARVRWADVGRPRCAHGWPTPGLRPSWASYAPQHRRSTRRSVVPRCADTVGAFVGRLLEANEAPAIWVCGMARVRGVPPPVCWLGARGQCDAGREQNEGNQRQLDDNMA